MYPTSKKSRNINDSDILLFMVLFILIFFALVALNLSFRKAEAGSVKIINSRDRISSIMNVNSGEEGKFSTDTPQEQEDTNQEPPTTETKNYSAPTPFEKMSIEQKIGQLLIFGFQGQGSNKNITEIIRDYHIGGVILFRPNIDKPVQVGRLTNTLQGESAKWGNQPLLIAIDQEWGIINRFKKNVTIFPGASELGKINPKYNAVNLMAKDTATQLKAMGINLNFAPVLDVAERNSFMYSRSFGNTPWRVETLGEQGIRGFQEGNVAACAKHFPGLGRAVPDPHNGTVKINISKTELLKKDIPPFKKAIEAKVDMIMVSNATYPAFDAVNPACFSSEIQTKLLRDKLNYQGLIITDDLEMGAAQSHGNIGKLAVEAIKSGSDLLLVCHTLEKQREVYYALIKAVKNNEISEERLNESLQRIAGLKQKLNLTKAKMVDVSQISSRVDNSKLRSDVAKIKRLMSR